ncbi:MULTISPECIES: hypothetical protein [Microcoleaceae]|uniref:hypothetical protein n=1 Tax=Microcoleaceae TaxID=1892252 RepID=UPI001880917F|nr:hypothetical protein [Tychonema sp. LEGE 06208]MBE9164353.1 hypothetical protein [Tychonema sp. LEGE 06208]
MWAISGIVRFLILDCGSFVVKADRPYRFFGGWGDFTREVIDWGFVRSRKRALSCLIRTLNNGQNILLRVKTLKPHI